MKISLVLLVVVVCLIPLNYLYSQEVQVPIDPENNIKIIDKEMESKLVLFSEYPDFQEARLYKKDDQHFILEISYLKDGETMRTKKEMNPQELDQFRQKIRSQIKIYAPTVGLDQSGRASLLTGTTLLSLGWYGWSVPYVLGAEGGVAAGLYLITSGAGFFLPYIWTKETEVTKGMANLSTGAGVLGLVHGAMISNMLDLSSSIFPFDNNTNAKPAIIVTSVVSISELLAGYYYSRENHVTEGKANIMMNSSFIGGLYAAGLTYLIADPGDSKVYSATSLLGTVGGLFFGNYLSNRQNYAPGDASIVTDSWLLGGMTGGTLLIFAEPEDAKIVVGTLLASSALGYYFGDKLIEGYDFSNSTSTYVSLGMLGGALVGGGLAAIILNNSEGSTAAKVGATLVTGGAMLGFGLTYGSLKENSKESGTGTSQLNFNINPMGFFCNKINQNGQYSIPFMTLNYRF